MTTEQSAVEVEIFKLRMDKTLGRIIDRERSAPREARELEPEMPKATVAEVLRQTREAIMESDPGE
jgi:hypothetical protein